MATVVTTHALVYLSRKVENPITANNHEPSYQPIFAYDMDRWWEVNRIYVAQDRDRWRASVNTVTDIYVS
jgi:hypothetical protein